MSSFNNPGAVSNGLVFAYDMGNLPKSFKGGPVTNLIPSPGLNAYPTTGNGWGTYNTNQYNSGSYFSIGSISSVSSNIVTTSGSHPLRTYDVVTPQTTGGGVTSGTNYLVKKLSNTTFCLYPYNSSQDGSQGYISSTTNTFKVYDDFANDNKISVTSSSFPTMWWGPPHLPNSGLVKEIRTRGFTNPYNGDVTDCMRLHYIRTDDVKDHMAYGVDTSMTPGTPHTVSFYYRAVDDAGVGKVIQYYVYNYTSSAAGYAQNFTLSRDWQKFVFTYTPAYNNSISYWFMQSGGVYSWDLACIQTEVGSVANQFVAGSRTNTQTLLDLTGRSVITAANMQYNSDGTFDYVYSSPSYVEVPLATAFNKLEGSINVWIYPTRYNGGNGIFVNRTDSTPNAGDWLWIGPYSNYFYFRLGDGSSCCSNDNSFSNYSTVVPLNTWTNLCCTWSSGGTSVIYINGKLYQSRAISSIPSTSPSSYGRFGLGHANADDYFNGRMPVAQIYNRQLTASEVNANFNAMRGRYGI